MTQEELLHAAGWDDGDPDRAPFIYEADDEAGGSVFDEVRFFMVRRGKALAVSIGFHEHGPTLVIRAFDGTRPAVVGCTSYEGSFVNITVAEPLSREEDL